MSTNPLRKLQYLTRVGKRAQYEAFEFELVADGVRVRNGSHANPEDHEYLVTVRDGVPSSCTCPADEHYEGACKHRVAVAIHRPVLDAVIEQQLVADGGKAKPVPDEVGDSHDTEESCDCDCDDLRDGFPCWTCYRDAKRTFDV
ncbi:SWIM zinc finger family protein [Haloarchaeobius sp. DFWS5]|uniref:SWIM zinc finger family protein n=1 Tax=Haloarchaeobius sp. DFWS5 TaxID=3446114 RepID=UPI003EBCFAAA